MSSTPRFIAGAVCPQCREVDRMQVRTITIEDGVEEVERRCVACGYSETLEQADPTMGLPRARFEKSKADATTVSPVKIMDPK